MKTLSPNFDVLKSYDTAITKLFNVQLDVPYRYQQWELEAMSLEQLRDIAAERSAFYETDHKSLLIRSVMNTQRVPVIFATPENAWGDPEYVQGIDTIAPNTKTTSVFYPAITITRVGISDDPSRYSVAPRRKIAWTSDGNGVLQGNQPLPKTLQYQADVFCLNMRHANLLSLVLQRNLGLLDLRLEVDHGPPWGLLPIHVDTTSIRENSQLEGDQSRAEKLLRSTYDLRVMGWIPQDVKLVRTVRKVRWTVTDETIPTAPKDLMVLPDYELPDHYQDE